MHNPLIKKMEQHRCELGMCINVFLKLDDTVPLHNLDKENLCDIPQTLNGKFTYQYAQDV